MIQLGVQYLPDSEIDAKVQECMVRYPHRSQIPFPVEELMEFDLELEILPLPNLQRDYEVEGFTTSDMKTVYVDEFVWRHRPTRYRFTLAHELGHILFHPEFFEQVTL